MAIEKLKLLTINGPSESLDQLLANVLFKSDLQIEDAKKIYDKGWKLTYFEYDYKIKDNLRKCENLLKKLDIPYSKSCEMVTLERTVSKISDEIESLNLEYENILKEKERIRKENIELEEKNEEISKIDKLDIDIEKLYNLKYVKFRYGCIPKKNLDEIKKEIDNLNTIMFEIQSEDNLVWIMYFTTLQNVGNIDGIFNIQKFERKLLPGDLVQKPNEYINKIKEKISKNDKDENDLNYKLENIRKKAMNTLIAYYRELQTYEKINAIKKNIVHDQNNTFYVVSWISEDSLKEIENSLEKFEDIEYVVEDGENPPTKLKNNKIIKPFESLVKMYGMPKMNELDPTLFVAISTFIMFGFMFGDLGHGFVFFVVGLMMMLKKQSSGAILFAGGISSMIFGILYGSVFGKEDIIPSILISPMNDISTMLVYGIAVGTVFILIAMILNIVNGIKNKDYKKIFLDANGVAGIVLYGFVLSCVAYYFLKGKMLISTNIIVIISLLLVLIIMFNDKIMNLINKKKKTADTPFVEKVFEIIEMILSFLSNTISFLRLAAFAINHAGLCMAVYLLADMTTGAGNLLIAIIGNVIVLVLEGLIVGIQTLRLEYYELFSRFYDGSGQEYKSINEQIEN